MSLVEAAIRRLAQAKAGARPARPEQEVVESSKAALPPKAPPLPKKQLPGDRPKRELDYARLRADGLLPAEHERKLFSQVYRGIKRPVLNRISQQEGTPDQARSNIVMVASAVSGDGKTFTAVNLAFSFAMERDKQVVLVDGDVVKRELSTRLGFGDDPGLIDLLEDSSLPVDPYVIQTDLPNLWVLPAGKTSLHFTELLSSTRMRAVMTELAAGSDMLVIFDSPPLLLTTESRAVAEICGQALLVVGAGKTSKDMVDRAVPLLQACPSVSLILNRSISQQHSGYGYGYGYGYGEKDASKDGSKDASSGK